MPVTTDIVATYRGPRRVIRRLLAMGEREDRALAILMAGCIVIFVAQWPRLAREAHLSGQDLNPILGGSLMAWLLIMPLVFYALAFVVFLLMRLMGARGSAFGARLALFWAVLASGPVMLFYGLLAGFDGDSVARQGVGVLWLVVFLWFWLQGSREAGWGTPG